MLPSIKIIRTILPKRRVIAMRPYFSKSSPSGIAVMQLMKRHNFADNFRTNALSELKRAEASGNVVEVERINRALQQIEQSETLSTLQLARIVLAFDYKLRYSLLLLGSFVGSLIVSLVYIDISTLFHHTPYNAEYSAVDRSIAIVDQSGDPELYSQAILHGLSPARDELKVDDWLLLAVHYSVVGQTGYAYQCMHMAHMLSDGEVSMQDIQALVQAFQRKNMGES